jgi:tRNA G18 (ribose-2'-O)-methylase SpoU
VALYSALSRGSFWHIPGGDQASWQRVWQGRAQRRAKLADLPAARIHTIAVLGHEQTGIPPEAVNLLDACVEIPMIGTDLSLNVAVAGSLVLYKLAGLL